MSHIQPQAGCTGEPSMASETEHRIRIHQSGSAVTDANAANLLAGSAPTAFRKAQDVLVAAKKYIEKSGIFSSERSRLQKLQSECYDLSRALRSDGFMASERTRRGETFVLIEFLSSFSDSFPNWQKEYELLNRYIPLFFRSMQSR